MNKVHDSSINETMDTVISVANLQKDCLYDDTLISTLSLQELRGHKIILLDGNDIDFQIGAILDGTTIDFLFGIKRGTINIAQRNRVQRLKWFLRQLSVHQLIAIIHFYQDLYNAIETYQSTQYKCLDSFFGLFGCSTSSRHQFEESTNYAFVKLKDILKK